MLLLAAWSTNGWLPSGHAMRMALDLGLHRALEKLADDSGKQRTQEEERDLCMIDSSLTSPVLIPNHQLFQPVYGFVSIGSTTSTFAICSMGSLLIGILRMSLGTGRPIVLRDENSIRHCRILLNHPMASPTDVRLIAQVELIAQKSAAVILLL